jgi:predicted dithiol-disulfide oxidoreductase (DUF899 family)
VTGVFEAEKELTRRSDELARRRQQLPWVRIGKEYVFDTDEGEQSLRDLFAGRSKGRRHVQSTLSAVKKTAMPVRPAR